MVLFTAIPAHVGQQAFWIEVQSLVDAQI